MVTRLSVDDAARYLGISRPTVKRRLKSGSLRGVQERTPSGFKWYVIVDEAESPGGVAGGIPTESPRESPAGAAAESPRESPSESATSPRVSPQTAILAQRAEEMARDTRDLLAPYVEKIEAQAERLGRLEAELEASRARVTELETAAVVSAPETPNGAAEPWPERRRWWQRVLWG